METIDKIRKLCEELGVKAEQKKREANSAKLSEFEKGIKNGIAIAYEVTRDELALIVRCHEIGEIE